jgi:nucleoporin GLE1
MPIPDYNKLVGRKESEQGLNYKQRMSGIISLYAAIVQTSPGAVPKLLSSPTVQYVPPFFRPDGGWKWCAMILRPPLPLLDTTALLLYVFLRMTGERFHQLFGRQYIKLLRAIAEQGIDNKQIKWNEGVQGDLSKVRLLIGDWLQSGQITGAEGRAPT